MKTKLLPIFLLTLILSASILPANVLSQSKTDTQIELEQQLKEIQEQIDMYQKELDKTQTEKKTLTNKLKELSAKQKSINLQIKQTAVKLNSLDGQIVTTEKGIKSNILKQKQLEADMASILRELNAVDSNIVVALVTTDGFSDVYTELQNYSDLTRSLYAFQQQARSTREKLTNQKEQLEDQKEEASNLLQIKSAQQQGLSKTIGEQNDLLLQTKGLESNYQAILTDTRKRAAEIRNRIYELFDVGKQITFGEAVEIAKYASNLTGVRPAFLLAILTQESNLGKNVGTCNRLNDPPEKSWKVIMKPTRDQEPFKQITSELGLDINITPVSCPMRQNGKQVGWGGAMGPAQFIPSTWMGYRDKVKKLTGNAVANPWDIRDAFVASAVKLKAGGADNTLEGEWKAAMRYFSGSTNKRFRFYGDNVNTLTKQYLQDIADL